VAVIANQEELEQSRQYLTVLESTVQDLRSRVRTRNPERFAIMASSYLEEIKKTRYSIDQYVGISLAQEDSNDFFVVFEGPEPITGMAPAPVVTRSIEALQTGLRKIGDYLARTEYHALLTRFQVARNFELSLATIATGSLRVGLKVSIPEDAQIPPESVAHASKKFVEALQVILRNHDGVEEFRRLVPDVSYQLQVLRAIRGVAPPRQKHGYRVTVGGRFISDAPLVLDEQQRSYLSRLIRATSAEAIQEGTVIEIDREKRVFHIRSEATRLRCFYSEDLAESAKDGLDHRVRIVGTASTNIDGSVKFIRVRQIIPIEN
jgi:hypothetical protein